MVPELSFFHTLIYGGGHVIIALKKENENKMQKE